MIHLIEQAPTEILQYVVDPHKMAVLTHGGGFL